MNTDSYFSKTPDTTNYFLQPGYIFVPDTPFTISTVIGSSVAVVLYDRKNHIGGMNHFQLPFIAEKHRATALYGNVATPALVKMVLSHGSGKKHVEAQIFGGAHDQNRCEKNIGRENIDMAKKVLLEKSISVISEDIGGAKGRKIVFNTNTNEIAVLKVDSLRSEDWYPY
ncbi:MAG TPA: chemotaxis protein CheD [Desulfobacteraceae bacterium]|nr:chemotaxis protein CheD [Desulfobacteraceae bacterium]